MRGENCVRSAEGMLGISSHSVRTSSLNIARVIAKEHNLRDISRLGARTNAGDVSACEVGVDFTPNCPWLRCIVSASSWSDSE